MIRFGRAPSVNFCDKHSTVVLFATVHCRGVEKYGRKRQKILSGEKRNAYIILIIYFIWMKSFEGLR